MNVLATLALLLGIITIVAWTSCAIKYGDFKKNKYIAVLGAALLAFGILAYILSASEGPELGTLLFTVLLTGAAGAAGGWVAGWLTRKAAEDAYRHTRTLEEEKTRQRVENFRKALLVEISTVWGLYTADSGKMVEEKEPGQPLFWYLPINQRYFTIYEENTDVIGLIQDNEERALIVHTYTIGKSLMDTYRHNNHMLMARDILQAIVPILGPHAATVDKELFNRLGDYSKVIERLHGEAKDAVKKLTEKLSSPITGRVNSEE